MELKDDVLAACKGIVAAKVRNARELRLARLEKAVGESVHILDTCNELTRNSDYSYRCAPIDGGYEVTYSGESISGTIRIVDSDRDTHETKPKDGNVLLSVLCRAHSCQTRSFYNGAIPEKDIIGFIRYATRGPTLNDRLRRMAGRYQGDF
ncbi:hypothetical protein FO488_05465 [Geobacter sp. FeAm09]|uniref:hypothetical protein n=1 Tax=Geobacter sp. FeAm09 TaxID=2597769 RepID=UPI0011EC446A|nr:hypothetical protein [Geobacter sp. FeAm09]QEM67654.1 hypothetical protein FO488_05465 [Geobacter sp. FeAm09]